MKRIMLAIVILTIIIMLIVTENKKIDNKFDIVAAKYNLSSEEKYCLYQAAGMILRDDMNPNCTSSPRLINATQEIIFSLK